MKRGLLVVLAAAGGVAIGVALSLAVFFLSESSFGEQGTSLRLRDPRRVEREVEDAKRTAEPTPTQSSGDEDSGNSGPGSIGDDHGGSEDSGSNSGSDDSGSNSGAGDSGSDDSGSNSGADDSGSNSESGDSGSGDSGSDDSGSGGGSGSG
jgi:hypothetical protein